MKKLLITYNICQAGNSNGVPYYLDCIRSLLAQTVMDSDDFKIAISGCAVNDPTKNQLQQFFGDNLSYNFIDELLPLSITFNDTVDQCVKHFGEFEGYLYIDSGISFWDPSKRYNAIDTFYNAFKQNEDAVLACMPSNDDGSSWWGITYEPEVDYQYKIGQCTNMHCQIFPEEWRKAYGRVLPDIFASNCMESVFSHMSAAIHKKYMMTQKIHVQHLHSLDGASIGSREPDPDKIPMSTMFETPGLLFKTKKDMDQKYAEGYEVGFGVEEYQHWWRSDKTKFDDNQFAIDPKLKDFLAKEMYLTKEEFDYEQIRRIWIPGR
jgi:hypothetical protein